MKFINKTNEEIINIVKSKEAFGGFLLILNIAIIFFVKD